jgi:hypothetical protein
VEVAEWVWRRRGDLVVDRRGEDGEAGRTLVLPGLNFTTDRAVLHYAIRTLLSRRWRWTWCAGAHRGRMFTGGHGSRQPT